MMPALPFRLALAVAIVATFGLSSARADIYTWVDAKGGLNVSNVPPPDDARVLKVMHTAKPPATSDPSAAPAPPRSPETQALADRVAQLEDQVQMARQQSPVVYAPVPSPPVPTVVQYFIQQPADQGAQYVDLSPPAPPYANSSCDPTWYSCGYGWGSGFYPYTVVVAPTSNFRPFRPGVGPRPPRPHPVMQTSLIQPLSVPVIQPLIGTQGVPVMAPRPVEGFRRG